MEGSKRWAGGETPVSDRAGACVYKRQRPPSRTARKVQPATAKRPTTAPASRPRLVLVRKPCRRPSPVYHRSESYEGLTLPDQFSSPPSPLSPPTPPPLPATFRPPSFPASEPPPYTRRAAAVPAPSSAAPFTDVPRQAALERDTAAAAAESLSRDLAALDARHPGARAEPFVHDVLASEYAEALGTAIESAGGTACARTLCSLALLRHASSDDSPALGCATGGLLRTLLRGLSPYVADAQQPHHHAASLLAREAAALRRHIAGVQARGAAWVPRFADEVAGTLHDRARAAFLAWRSATTESLCRRRAAAALAQWRERIEAAVNARRRQYYFRRWRRWMERKSVRQRSSALALSYRRRAARAAAATEAEERRQAEMRAGVHGLTAALRGATDAARRAAADPAERVDPEAAPALAAELRAAALEAARLLEARESQAGCLFFVAPSWAEAQRAARGEAGLGADRAMAAGDLEALEREAGRERAAEEAAYDELDTMAPHDVVLAWVNYHVRARGLAARARSASPEQPPQPPPRRKFSAVLALDQAPPAAAAAAAAAAVAAANSLAGPQPHAGLDARRAAARPPLADVLADSAGGALALTLLHALHEGSAGEHVCGSVRLTRSLAVAATARDREPAVEDALRRVLGDDAAAAVSARALTCARGVREEEWLVAAARLMLLRDGLPAATVRGAGAPMPELLRKLADLEPPAGVVRLSAAVAFRARVTLLLRALELCHERVSCRASRNEALRAALRRAASDAAAAVATRGAAGVAPPPVSARTRDRPVLRARFWEELAGARLAPLLAGRLEWELRPVLRELVDCFDALRDGADAARAEDVERVLLDACGVLSAGEGELLGLWPGGEGVARGELCERDDDDDDDGGGRDAAAQECNDDELVHLGRYHNLPQSESESRPVATTTARKPRKLGAPYRELPVPPRVLVADAVALALVPAARSDLPLAGVDAARAGIPYDWRTARRCKLIPRARPDAPVDFASFAEAVTRVGAVSSHPPAADDRRGPFAAVSRAASFVRSRLLEVCRARSELLRARRAALDDLTERDRESLSRVFFRFSAADPQAHHPYLVVVPRTLSRDAFESFGAAASLCHPADPSTGRRLRKAFEDATGGSGRAGFDDFCVAVALLAHSAAPDPFLPPAFRVRTFLAEAVLPALLIHQH